MSKDYKIVAVSDQQKHWKNKAGVDMVTYFVRLEGEGDTIVQLNKMSKSNPPKDGETLTGTLSYTDYGPKLTVDYSQPSESSKSENNMEGIARSVALKAALERCIALNTGDSLKPENIIEVADIFAEWLIGQKTATESPSSKASDDILEGTKQAVHNWEKAGQDKVTTVIDGERINLDEIPF